MFQSEWRAERTRQADESNMGHAHDEEDNFATTSFEGRTASRVHYLKQSTSHAGTKRHHTSILMRC